MIGNQAAGIAIFGGVIDPALVRPRSRGTNLAFIGPEHLSSIDQDPAASTILADDAAGMAAAVAEALRLGYRHFAFLDGPGVASNIRRRTAASNALAEAGVERLRVYKSAARDGRSIVRKIVQDRRDVILCFDDQRSLRLLSALTRAGVKVPDDVGIIGFDDIPFASISNPPLSTIAVPYARMGQMACKMLLRQLRSETTSDPERVDVRLVLRGTTAQRR